MTRGRPETRVTLVPATRPPRVTPAAHGSDAEHAQLVEHVLAEARLIARRALLDATVQIGDLLVKHFFAGDLDLARSTRSDKPVAFRRLLERAPAHELSPGLLKRAIAVSVQYRELPQAVRDRLSTSQHLALLPVADHKVKAKLAAQAVSEHLPARALTHLVREKQPKAKTGRKPLTTLEKSVTTARRALVSAVLEAELSQAKLRRIPPSRRDALQQALHTLRERIERYSDALARLKP